ncbi:MAG: hypothetical protein JWQ10_371 [Herbaspirillum sp.]|nr:hypothetical protein [Herbaspirillum sp.]
MKRLIAFVFLATVISTAVAQENANFSFVSEFTRELTALENIRATGEHELKEKGSNPITGGIRNSTRVQLELGSSIAMLQGIHLQPPVDDVRQNIVTLYKRKIAYHQKLIDIASQFMAGQKPGVDYGQLAAEIPKITASLEYLDETLFKAAPVVFGSLIDMRADHLGHASHLVITAAERKGLIRNIKSSFGAKLDAKNQNYIVSSAWVLLSGLQKFKSSDEPW